MSLNRPAGNKQTQPLDARRSATAFFLLLLLSILIFTAAGNAGAEVPVRLRLIVTATAREAQEVLSAVRSGKSFAQLAKERSIDKSSDRYGELDSTAISSLPGPLRTAIPPLREGDISGVVRLADDRYALLQFIDLRQYRLGAAAFRAGDVDRAEKHLRRHLDENPDAIKARLMLGALYERQDLPEQALTLYNDVLLSEPGNRDAASRINVLLASKRVIDTLPVTSASSASKAQRIVDILPAKTAQERTETKTSQPAGIPLRMIIASSEKQAEAIIAEFNRGKPFFFLAHDSSADKRSSEDYGDLGVVDPTTLHPAIQTALAALQPGRISSIIRLGEGRYAIIQVKDMGYFAESEKALSAGDDHRAEQHLLKHLSTNPEDTEARMMLASLYEKRLDTALAEDAYTQAIVFKPRDAVPYEKLGKLYLGQGNFTKAKDVFGRGLRLTSSHRILEKLMEIATISLIGTVR